MSVKLSNKSAIHKILVISLTNIGDVILTFPVLDVLKRDFPSAKLSVVIGPKAKSLLKGNPHLDKVFIFDKHQPPLKSLSWVLALRRERFDLVVDLRNTAIPLMISPRYRTSCRVRKTTNLHMREKHLNRLKSVYEFKGQTFEPCALYISEGDERDVHQLIEREIGPENKYVVVAPGAADGTKRWPEKGFSSVCDRLTKEHNTKIIFVGNNDDRQVVRRIDQLMEAESIDLSGRLSLIQLAVLFKHCYLAVVNDSAPLHLASYLNVPVLALFGPTDPVKYGPWGPMSCYLRKNELCRACAQPKTSMEHTCMAAITGEDVFKAMRAQGIEDDLRFKK